MTRLVRSKHSVFCPWFLKQFQKSFRVIKEEDGYNAGTSGPRSSLRNQNCPLWASPASSPPQRLECLFPKSGVIVNLGCQLDWTEICPINKAHLCGSVILFPEITESWNWEWRPTLNVLNVGGQHCPTGRGPGWNKSGMRKTVTQAQFFLSRYVFGC